MQLVEQRNSIPLSITLHLVLVLFAAFGLPKLLPKAADPLPLVMTVEILPIGAETNVKPSDKPITKEQKAPTPVNKKPIEPTVKEEPKPPEPAPAKPEPKPEPKPAPKDTPRPEPVKDAEPLPDAKKDDKKPKDDKKAKDDFAALLSKLKQESKPDKTPQAKDTATTAENKTTSDAPYDASKPLALSEIDAIRGQFIPCWRMPMGAKDPKSLAALVHITLQPDGTVLTAELASSQQSRYASDPFFRAAADAAIRAAHQCSPLKNLPVDKYNSWRDLELNFDPSTLM